MKAVKYISILIIFCTGYASAQQLHFSQYFNAPLLVNPANTGFNPDYDYRIGGNYRNQWANVISNPYQTMNLWGDAQIISKKYESGWGGIGGTVYKDQAGSGNLTSTQEYLSLAYHQLLGNSSLLSLGFNVGAVNKRVDVSKLTFDNEWNGQFFSANTPNGGENFARTSVTYFDLQIGLNYALFITDRAYFNVGFSAMHINKPSESFFAPSSESNPTVPIRSTIFLNASFKIEDLWILNPNIYISQSAGSTETLLGMNATRKLDDDGAKQILAGIYYRNKDAVIPMVGYVLNDLKITVSYDVTTSALGNYNGNQGGYEASIIKSGSYGRPHPIKCPSMKF
jgi:type IX secretion system PorP/SprF family membrane protein